MINIPIRYDYSVQTKADPKGSREKTMKDGKFSSKKQAESFYKKHKRATRIQRTERKTGHSAGIYNPDAPSKTKIRGKPHIKAYQGPHTEKEAKKMQKAFMKEQKIKMKIKKTKHGSFLYYQDAN